MVKKHDIVFMLLFVFILSLSAVSTTDNMTDDTTVITGTDNTVVSANNNNTIASNDDTIASENSYDNQIGGVLIMSLLKIL